MRKGLLENLGSLIGRFVGFTMAIAVIGMTMIFASVAILPEGSEPGTLEPSGPGLFLMVIGFLLFFGSPVIAWLGLAHMARRSKKILDAEQSAEAAKVAQSEAHRQRFFERERLIDNVDKHRAALVRNLERAVRKNDYGAVVEDNRSEALLEFFASIDLDLHAIDMSEAAEVVMEQLASYEEQDRRKGFDATSLPFDGYAFERWVASALIGFGWEAEVTTASGDQGIDVIALRDGKKIGLQCKLYSSPIGNKAVQEAHAGKAFYSLDKVGVLSNAAFTGSAKALASTTGVLLLSHHDIPKLFETAFLQ